MEVSLGTTKDDGDPASTDGALGVRLTFMDNGDPMRDPTYTKEIGDVIDQCAPSMPGEDGATQLKCMADKSKDIRANYAGKHWNANRVQGAFAIGSQIAGSGIEHMRYSRFSAWVVGGTPFVSSQHFGYLVFEVKYDGVKFPEAAEELTYGTRAIVGTSHMTAFLELTGLHNFEKGAMTPNQHKWSAGVDLNVSGSTWVAVGFGDTFGDEGVSTLFANLKWATSDADRFSDLKK